MSPVLATLRSELERAGFRLCGAFHPCPADAVPTPPTGRPVATLLVIGNAGPALWRAIGAAPEAADPDRFDRYTRRVIGDLAAALGAATFFPCDGPPWLPFQRWAQRAEPGLRASPLGMLIHPRYGLWHAYRAALGLADRLPLPPPAPVEHPCERCSDRPCLTACPAGALGAAGYDVGRCRAWLAQQPAPACLASGCRARHACPVGRAFAHDPDQAAHHMRAFASPRG